MNEKHTFIINHSGMDVGGIEVTVSKLMKYCMEQNYRVIWITNKTCYKKAAFREIIEDSRIEKVFISTWQKLLGGVGKSKIRLSKDENVTMISCDILNFADAEELRKAGDTKTFYHFMLLPHYTGSVYYPERLFNVSILRNYCFKQMKTIAVQLIRNDCVRAFSGIQLDAYEDNYKVEIKDKKDKVLKSVSSLPSLDVGRLTERATMRKHKLIITSCARFDFPHKAYLLGLIDAFQTLGTKYDFLQLCIVGYGDGQAEIEKKVHELPAELSKRVKLTGKKSPDELLDIYNESSINVGLAGALMVGAGCGLPSLVVQHYSPECGCFGFLEDVKASIVEGTGTSIIPYLEELINCSDQEYIAHGIGAYNIRASRVDNHPEYLFTQKNISSKAALTDSQRLFCKILHCIATVMYRVFKISGYAEKQS